MNIMPENNPGLGRTLNEKQWGEGEEAFRKTGQDTLVRDYHDGWQFWVVSYNGHMARKTVYKDRVWFEPPMTFLRSGSPKQS